MCNGLQILGRTAAMSKTVNAEKIATPVAQLLWGNSMFRPARWPKHGVTGGSGALQEQGANAIGLAQDEPSELLQGFLSYGLRHQLVFQNPEALHVARP